MVECWTSDPKDPGSNPEERLYYFSSLRDTHNESLNRSAVCRAALCYKIIGTDIRANNLPWLKLDNWRQVKKS